MRRLIFWTLTAWIALAQSASSAVDSWCDVIVDAETPVWTAVAVVVVAGAGAAGSGGRGAGDVCARTACLCRGHDMETSRCVRRGERRGVVCQSARGAGDPCRPVQVQPRNYAWCDRQSQQQQTLVSDTTGARKGTELRGLRSANKDPTRDESAQATAVERIESATEIFERTASKRASEWRNYGGWTRSC